MRCKRLASRLRCALLKGSGRDRSTRTRRNNQTQQHALALLGLCLCSPLSKSQGQRCIALPRASCPGSCSVHALHLCSGVLWLRLLSVLVGVHEPLLPPLTLTIVARLRGSRARSRSCPTIPLTSIVSCTRRVVTRERERGTRREKGAKRKLRSGGVERQRPRAAGHRAGADAAAVAAHCPSSLPSPPWLGASVEEGGAEERRSAAGKFALSCVLWQPRENFAKCGLACSPSAILLQPRW